MYFCFGFTDSQVKQMCLTPRLSEESSLWYPLWPPSRAKAVTACGCFWCWAVGALAGFIARCKMAPGSRLFRDRPGDTLEMDQLGLVPCWQEKGAE